MGHFYNYLEGRYDPIDHDRELTHTQLRRIRRRADLIEALITELEKSRRDSGLQLYVGLAARALTATDEKLLREFGQRLAEMATPPKVRSDGGR